MKTKIILSSVQMTHGDFSRGEDTSLIK